MALENVMRVDNGNIVTGGGTGGNSVEIDWEDWCKLTPEEQETGDWTIINCPWADGDVSVDLMTKLWENPNPTQAMASDTEISINDTDYDFLAYVCFLRSTNNKVIPLVLTPKNNDAYVCYADSGNALQRRFDYSNGKVTAKTGYIGSTVDNTYIILYQIYGIKLTATVKINAIAMDVSTSADKCMLSENESVKDRIGDILFVEKSISNKSISTAWGSMFIANETVDISSLGLSNAPDVVSVTFGTTEARIALCAADAINKNNITVALIRPESGTVSGKIIITLKSNG